MYYFLKWYLAAILVYPFSESNQRRRVLECLYFYIWCHDGLFVMFPAAIRQRELRLLSKSVWRVFILYNVMNGLSMPLIINGFIKPAGTLSVIFSPTNVGIFVSILFGVAG